MRHLVLAAAFALAACAQNPPPASPSASRTTASRSAAPAPVPPRAGKPQAGVRRLPATPAQLRRYEQAVAKDLRDPASARFSSTYLVESEGNKGLCGFVSEKDGAGRYAARKMFHASLVDLETGASAMAISAPPSIEPRASRAALAEKCRVGR
jgi:hypothetical protein